MPRKPRIHYTEIDKALMWDRWRKGDSLETIAQLSDCSPWSAMKLFYWLSASNESVLRCSRSLAALLTDCVLISCQGFPEAGKGLSNISR